MEVETDMSPALRSKCGILPPDVHPCHPACPPPANPSSTILPSPSLLLHPHPPTMSSTDTPMDGDKVVLSVASSHNGRVNGKHWKAGKGATKRTTMPKGQRTPYERRMEKEKERKAIKQVEQEMKDEAREERER